MLSDALTLGMPYSCRPLMNLVQRTQLVWLLADPRGQSLLLSKALRRPVAVLLQCAAAFCFSQRGCHSDRADECPGRAFWLLPVIQSNMGMGHA